MKKEMINKLPLFLLVLLGCLSFISCEDDNDGPQYSITGEWFLDESDGNQTKRTIKEFTSDGQYHGSQYIVGAETNIREIADGIYTYKNNTINAVFSTPYDARHYSESYKVISADKYSLSIRVENTGNSGVMHRVVDTYDIKLGEKRNCIVNDPAFNAVAYMSYDENIAFVDADGVVCGMKRGITYVKIVSSEGEAIIRIKVSDADNLMEDYVKYIYAPIDQVYKDFGNNYLQYQLNSGLTVVQYNLMDDAVKEVTFNYLIEEHVYNVQGAFRHSVDLNAIIASFDQKYEKRPSTADHIHYYYAYNEEHLIRLMIDAKTYTFMFEVTPSAIEEYDGMVTLRADTFAKWFGFDLKDSYGLFTSIIDNDVYKGIIMEYDEDTMEILKIQLVCRAGVEESDLRDWFEEHYYIHDLTSLTIYCTHPVFPRSEYYVMISTNPKTGNVNVVYQKNY